METLVLCDGTLLRSFSLYSLEKLVEWKLRENHQDISFQGLDFQSLTLYSLEKLVEWKL
jgi:hypothetical protein